MAITLVPIKKQDTFMHKYNVKVFFLCLPFGQVVPIFLMLYTSYPTFFNTYFNRCEYQFKFALNSANIFKSGDSNTDSPSRTYSTISSNDVEFEKLGESFTAINDPFSSFIRNKLVSHFGFIIEAVVESTPQSILQMIYLIMYHSSSSFNMINIASILMSMIVVVSKGSLLSYSIYRKASVFNFLCFALDIFGIFTVAAWLFALNQDDTTAGGYAFFGHDMWYVGYYYFDMLYYIYMALLWMAFWGYHCLITETYRKYPNHPWRNLPELILIPIAVLLLLIPASLVLFTVRFTLIPLLILNPFDHSQNKSYAFYNKIYSFIANSLSLDEIHEKVLITNWLLAKVAAKHKDTGVAYLVSKQMQKHYDDHGSVSLSHLYSVLHKLDSNYWIHYKFHQIFEIIALLISRKGFWKFIFVRLSSNTCDMDRYAELETAFWKTIQQIQEIIHWDGLAQRITHYWTQCIIQFTIIRHWFHNINWRQLPFTCYQTLCIVLGLFCVWMWNDVICDKIPTFVFWFGEGFACALEQDITNIYYTMRRIIHGRVINQNRSAITLGEYMDLQDPKYAKIHRNKQILSWNIPSCWSHEFVHNNTDLYIYQSNNPPYIGRGLVVFMVVIIFKCIHCPLRNLFGLKLVDDICAVMAVIPGGIVVVLLVLLIAIYSLFAPVLFIIQHWIVFGLFDLDHNRLQLVFTWCYLAILFGIMSLLPHVWKFVYSSFHLFSYFADNKTTPEVYADHVIEVFYSKLIRNELIDEVFGTDLGGMIKSYLPSFQIWNKKY
eukprot:229124_1